jgi:hypothetical protein
MYFEEHLILASIFNSYFGTSNKVSGIATKSGVNFYGLIRAAFPHQPIA